MSTEKYIVTMDSRFNGTLKTVGDVVELDEEQARIRTADGHVRPAPATVKTPK